MSKTTFSYTIEDFRRDIGGDPSEYEIDDLAHHYPTYGKDWRPAILEGIKEGKTNSEIFLAKLEALDAENSSARSKGGLARNISYKLQRAAIRILFLRFTLKDGMTQNHARKKLHKLFALEMVSIRKATIKKPFPPT